MCRPFWIVLLLGCFATQRTAAHSGCIVLIGGVGDQKPELYHPTAKGCRVPKVNMIAISNLEETSGCYLAGRKEIVTRGTGSVKPMVYDVQKGTTRTLPYPTATWYSTNKYKPSWSGSAPLNDHTCISCGGQLKIGWPVDDCFKYSGGGKGWQTFKHLPRKIEYATAVTLGNKLYVIGTEEGRSDTSIYVYNDKHDKRRWEKNHTMTNIRGVHVSAALSKHEFLDCGSVQERSGAKWSTACYTYDINKKQKGAEKQVASLPRAMRHPGGGNLVNFGGHVYALGGREKAVYVYKNRAWEKVTSHELKQPRVGAIVVAVQPSNTRPPPKTRTTKASTTTTSKRPTASTNKATTTTKSIIKATTTSATKKLPTTQTTTSDTAKPPSGKPTIFTTNIHSAATDAQKTKSSTKAEMKTPTTPSTEASSVLTVVCIVVPILALLILIALSVCALLLYRKRKKKKKAQMSQRTFSEQSSGSDISPGQPLSPAADPEASRVDTNIRELEENRRTFFDGLSNYQSIVASPPKEAQQK